MAFDADDIGRQVYEVRKLLRDLKIHIVLLSETRLKADMRLCIPTYELQNLSD
jgi:hypothetical protein